MAAMLDRPVDEGVCLSMHQPWASLLVYGIKRIEGRSWPTNHRGRLWIHATSQHPSTEDIQAWEALYRRLHCELDGRPSIKLPPSYPTSVLLGCVDVVDCLEAKQVEAWGALPPSLRDEVGSPWCFLCQRPQRLVVLHPMRGQMKLYKLDKKVHRAALQGLTPAPNGSAFSWAVFGLPPPPSADLPASASKHRFAEHQAAAAAARQGGGGADAAKARKGEQAQSPRAAAAAARQQQHLEARQEQAGQQEQARGQKLEQQQQDPARRLRALQKKLRQATALVERAAAGQALSKEEAAKAAAVVALEAEAAELEAAGARQA